MQRSAFDAVKGTCFFSAPMKKPPQHPLKIWRESQVPPLSQLKTGLKLNTTGVSVGRWEAGAMPDFDTLVRIEKLTGLTGRFPPAPRHPGASQKAGAKKEWPED
jgi:hypothetical protein